MKKSKALIFTAAIALAAAASTPYAIPVIKRHFFPLSNDEIMERRVNAISHLTEKNYSELIADIEPLVDYKDPLAMSLMARLYFEGTGVPQNYKKAIELYTEAAEMQEIQAQLMLSKIYGEAIGTDRNLIKSYVWASRACANEDAFEDQKEWAVSNRDLISRRLSRDDLLKAQDEASDWKPKKPGT